MRARTESILNVFALRSCSIISYAIYSNRICMRLCTFMYRRWLVLDWLIHCSVVCVNVWAKKERGTITRSHKPVSQTTSQPSSQTSMKMYRWENILYQDPQNVEKLCDCIFRMCYDGIEKNNNFHTSVFWELLLGGIICRKSLMLSRTSVFRVL